MSAGDPPAVSVVITTYNHAAFIGEAIRSVLDQTQAAAEIIVVDDGSTDNTASIVRSFSSVRYLPKQNEGLPAARNTGLLHATGEFIVFLDADDRLVSIALEIGVREHLREPGRALVAGQYVLIDRDGREFHLPQRPVVERDHYRALLESNFIGNPAAVMYRTGILRSEGGFDRRLRACEDYELYLRLARRFPIVNYGVVVSEYRQHGANMSGNPTLMLRSAVGVLLAERRHLRGRPDLQMACEKGIRFYKKYYGNQLADQVLLLEREHRWAQVLPRFLTLCRYRPDWVRHHLVTKSRGALRRLFRRPIA
jgi:glycosyltransferase involved in cell wall biosynthesis